MYWAGSRAALGPLALWRREAAGQHYRATVGDAALRSAVQANWPVRQIDRNLISRSIGIDPLYDRRMGS